MTHDLAVVGLGVVGAAAVHAATRAGARVVALDAGAAGSGTSGTSFAWLNACKKEPDAYHRLNAAGMTAHRELAAELGADGGHHPGGSLEWAEGDDAELRTRVERLAARGYAAEFIGRDRALALEPGLAIPETVRDVGFYANDAWLDVPRLIRTLLAGAAVKGAAIREHTAVRSIRRSGDRVDALVTDAGELTAGAILFCVGPSTQAFLAPLGISLPVGRVSGLLAITSRPRQPLTRVVHAPGVHLRPDIGGGLMLGADDLDGPVVEAASPARRDEIAAELLARAGRVFPATRDVSIVEHRVGVRPMPADRHSIVGRLPGLSNAWIVATHSGVTLGPLLGRLVTDEIVHGAPSAMLAPFRPERFATATAR